jgi:hypothetical protein
MTRATRASRPSHPGGRYLRYLPGAVAAHLPVSERSLAGPVRGGALSTRHETYLARADAGRALRLAGTTSPFTIELRFLGGLDHAQLAAFAAAADRWVRVVVGELPGVLADGEYVDDVLVLVQGVELDGAGGIVGQAGPTHLRPAAAGEAAYLPAKGIMSFDVTDLELLASEGTLVDVLAHELGHVLGFGTTWKHKGLIGGETSYNPTFSGAAAMAEYQALRGGGRLRRVPAENAGGPGTRGGHWREALFRHELMSSVAAGSPLSRLTAASLADLGYEVDLDAADAYTLPDLLSAEEPQPPGPGLPHPSGTVLPVIPIVLPPAALDV